jgi:hypothetical protein
MMDEEQGADDRASLPKMASSGCACAVSRFWRCRKTPSSVRPDCGRGSGQRASPSLAGQLPKDYGRFDGELLERMLRMFDSERTCVRRSRPELYQLDRFWEKK